MHFPQIVSQFQNMTFSKKSLPLRTGTQQSVRTRNWRREKKNQQLSSTHIVPTLAVARCISFSLRMKNCLPSAMNVIRIPCNVQREHISSWRSQAHTLARLTARAHDCRVGKPILSHICKTHMPTHIARDTACSLVFVRRKGSRTILHRSPPVKSK